MGILTFLSENVEGLSVLILCIFSLLLAIQWLAWIFSWGRFKELARDKKSEEKPTIGYVLANLVVKVIDDFRHLLALFITLIFGASLGYGIVKIGTSPQDISDVLQAVSSSLGGLIGAIIGYYFGESSAKRQAAENGEIPSGSEVIQAQEDIEEQEVSADEEIVQAPLPREFTQSEEEVEGQEKSEDEEGV